MPRSLPDIVTNLRYHYHFEAIDINNVLNQFGLRSDEKAEECAKNHVMTIFEDILPRLGYDTSKYFQEDWGPCNGPLFSSYTLVI